VCAVDSFGSHVPFQKRNEHFEGLQIHIHYLSFSFHIFYIITIHTKKKSFFRYHSFYVGLCFVRGIYDVYLATPRMFVSFLRGYVTRRARKAVN
jgi:hypothetical protein